MSDTVYDRVNDYARVKINLASPNDIRSWSFGEVKKPETINYRTYRPERDGLFCERIFGPERDYECACGKYKGTKYKGIICDRCGVKVTHSRVRRQRMGHINLAAPVVHIWFFKAMPSRLGNLLEMKTSDLEKIIYFQDWVVTDPRETDLEFKDVLTDEAYREAIAKHGHGFTAMMGAEAIRELLSANHLDLHALSLELREGIEKTTSKQRLKDLAKRLKLVEQIRQSENDPQWMVLDVVPVIPPDLRPLVLLESGNFATSDLNDLYRRIINRNNRLKKLMDLNAPEVIVRNEKRMLQQAVDALFDNGRCRRPVLGSSNRPLKSITDMIKGKQGRFRENLLGKRVDYSARSVIVVGPELKLWQCGLPKKIALELFQPFIIRKLKEHGLADTIKAAKRMLERRDPEVWDILEQVIRNHPVLLNRAPTLHRMGIQAFEPVLVEGNAIMIHPLVCTGYNADFDGDQMAVHLPLSVEAQAEAHVLMMSTHNIFSPANGNPIVSPSQDIIMGVYFLTAAPIALPRNEAHCRRRFKDVTEALLAMDLKEVSMHEPISIRLERFESQVIGQGDVPVAMPASRRIITTTGRVMFSEILSDGMPFYNCTLGKKGAARVIDDTFARKGKSDTIDLLDKMKEIGFKTSTTSGLSFGITDLRIPADKAKLIQEAQKKVDKALRNFEDGANTDGERKNHVMDAWNKCRDDLIGRLMETLKNDRRDPKTGRELPIIAKGNPDERPDITNDYINPVFLFMDSGARGNKSQLQQLAGMRGLMQKPNGETIETPIRANFREGLTVLEYFTSTHGARKGLSDTALKTADSGYLTRKLCDVAQSLVVNEHDCGTELGISKEAIFKGDEVDIPLRDLIEGRTSTENIIDPRTDRVLASKNHVINATAAREIEELGVKAIRVRSALTCQTPRGCCALCYGMDMSSGKLVEEGLAVGIIAAQSIGEPGTQLTMRTFHTGGISMSSQTDTAHKANQAGTISVRDCAEVLVTTTDGDRYVALRKTGTIHILDAKGRELEHFKVPQGATINAKDGDTVKKGTLVAEWDPHLTPILAEKSGTIRFHDITEGETIRTETRSRNKETVVIEHTGEKHPRITIEDATGHVLDYHLLPAKARIEVLDGQPVQAGWRIASLSRTSARSADITGGLPRVTEIFEARIPKDPAVMAEIAGRVELLSGEKRGKMTIRIHPVGDSASRGIEPRDHHVDQSKRLLVHAGDKVTEGDALTEGPRTPSEILQIQGEDALYDYMLREIQNVYRAQGVPIADKHIEVILRQMLSKVRVEKVGDTELLPYDVVDRWAFKECNDRLLGMMVIVDGGDTDLKKGAFHTKDEIKFANNKAEANKKVGAKTRKPVPARGRSLLLGITKASLQSESFLSGASFQETTKVLTEAALKGAVDNLVGLKENVLLGHLIPAGTGFERYCNLVVHKLVEEPEGDYDDESEMSRARMDAEALGAEPVGVAETITNVERLMPQPAAVSDDDDQAIGNSATASDGSSSEGS
ncbi:MAG: DNA-directed RNA polymerase subunit beta' [Phycisphaerales bacterium]|nr:DNA-directed RNA polymerase subunit beta' [Phycisphaerales bacterium]